MVTRISLCDVNLIFSVHSYIFSDSYFCVFLFNSGSFTFIFSSFILNLLSILTSSKLLAIFIVLSIFLLFHLCAYYLVLCGYFIHPLVLQNKVRNVGLIIERAILRDRVSPVGTGLAEPTVGKIDWSTQ